MKTKKFRFTSPRIIGLINDEERKDVSNFVNDLLGKNKKSDYIESGYFGVKSPYNVDDELWFDIYRVIGVAKVKKVKVK